MKSRIRSRWHRANEKPLEAQSTTATRAPMGEFIPSDDQPLVDDLTNAKPPAQNEKSQPRRERSEFKKPRNDRNGQHRGRNHRGENKGGQHGSDGEERPRKKRSHGKKPHTSRGEKNRNHGDKKPSSPGTRETNKGSAEKSRNPRKSNGQPKSSPAKKSGLGGFISKLFGG